MWLRFYVILYILIYVGAAPIRRAEVQPISDFLIKDALVPVHNYGYVEEDLTQGSGAVFLTDGVSEEADIFHNSGDSVDENLVDVSSGSDIEESENVESSGGQFAGGSGDAFLNENVFDGSGGADLEEKKFVTGSGDGSGYGFDDDAPLKIHTRVKRGYLNPIPPDYYKIGKNNNAAEMFYRECAGGGKDCRGQKREQSAVPASEPVAKKSKISEEVVEEPNNDENLQLSPGGLLAPEVEECYFAKSRKTQEETEPRSEQAQVSTDCPTANLISFKTLMDDEIDLYGTTNVAQIVLERGGGEFGLNFENAEIKNEVGQRKLCPHHYAELFTKWDTRNYKHLVKSQRSKEKKVVCSMDNRYHPHEVRPFINKNFVKVTSRAAASFLKKNGILIHVGLPVCPDHGRSLEKILAENIVEKDGYSIEPYFEDPGSSPSIIRPVDEDTCTAEDGENIPPKCRRGMYAESSSSQSQDSLKDPPFKSRDNVPLSSPPIKATKEVQDAFYSFCKATGATRCKLMGDFGDLKRRTQQKKVCQYRKLMDVIAEMMAGDKKDVLISMANSKNSGFDWLKNPDKQMEIALTYVREQYRVADGRDLRLNVIAQVAHIYPLAAIQKFVPGLTSRFYQAARVKAKYRLTCPDKPKEKRKTHRYNNKAATYFINFITSPPVSTMLPSSQIKVKAPDGTKTSIPAVMRTFHDAEVISMYEKHCEEEGYDDCSLSEYVMRSILKTCVAKKQKALECVDYYLVYGKEAFSAIKQIVKNLFKKGLIDEQWQNHLIFGLDESENYYKTDYYTQIKPQSRIGDLCLHHALSDPTNKNFQAKLCPNQETGAHDHDLNTDRIRLFDRTVVDLRVTLSQLIDEINEELEQQKVIDQAKINQKIDLMEKRDDFFKAEKDILEWEKHIVRSKYSNHVREEIIAGLQEGEALVTIDYATRYLPRKHTEVQSDFFGKKGLSWHICHVITVIGEDLVQHTFTHLLGEEDQNGQAVTAILTDVFIKLKNLNINKLTIRSDNAGYYKNAQVLVSLPVIAAEVGITLGHYSFSESQFGKAEADREAGRMKWRMHYALNHGLNIQSGDEMLAAITSGTIPLSGLTVVLAELNYVAVEKKASIPHISELHDFVYGERNIRFWKHYKIGPGETIRQSKFDDCVIRPTLTVTREWDHSPEDLSYTFWMSIKNKKDEKGKEPQKESASSKKSTSEIDVDPEVSSSYSPQKLISCTVMNCEKQFQTWGHFFNHMIRGDHQLAVEKVTLQEFAFKLYQNRLEGFVDSRQSRLNQRALETEEATTDKQKEMGWALKTTKWGGRYTTDMRVFLDEEFKHYYSKKKKPDVKEVAEKMASGRNSDGKRRFTAEERLNSRQIAAYYKRKAEKLREQIEEELELTAEQQEEVSDSIIQEMNDETGEIEIEHEDVDLFITEEEEILSCTKSSFKNDEALTAAEEEARIRDLYTDEQELVTLYQQQQWCP